MCYNSVLSLSYLRGAMTLWFYLEFSGRGPDYHFAGNAKDVSEEAHVCLPCREGCPYCADDSPCFVQEDKYLRLAIISFQALCMLLDFVSMLVVYHFRKAKVNPGTLVMIFHFIIKMTSCFFKQIEFFQIPVSSLLSRNLTIIGSDKSMKVTFLAPQEKWGLKI